LIRRSTSASQACGSTSLSLLATTILNLERGDLRAVMDQGSWLVPESVLAYAHDVPDHRRAIVNRRVLGTPAIIDRRSAEVVPFRPIRRAHGCACLGKGQA
jgi:hypothetical protein